MKAYRIEFWRSGEMKFGRTVRAVNEVTALAIVLNDLQDDPQSFIFEWLTEEEYVIKISVVKE